MRLQVRLQHSCALHFLTAYGADGFIDFEKAAGGEPKNLRQCSTYAYDPNSRAGSIWDLYQAYDSIKKAVIANCGEGPDPNIAQATNIYNNYCSANGFDIPGYTYIVTVTVPLPTDTSEGNIHESTAKAPDLTVPGSAASSVPTTDPRVTTGGNESLLTAVDTVTIVKSSGTKLQRGLMSQMLYLVPSILFKYISACAESLIVTQTAPPPLPAISTFVTQYQSAQGRPDISTTFEYEQPPYNVKTSTTLVVSKESSTDVKKPTTGTDDRKNNSGDNGDSPTRLEIVRIVIGIITALAITFIALWMCTKGQKNKD